MKIRELETFTGNSKKAQSLRKEQNKKKCNVQQKHLNLFTKAY